ncbi:MAG: bacteriochlorophyll 4-vinyl reductase [Hyphomicrobium sp.]|nr:bacteriochlorophyll 4-vinyl reductase [Hyphomicrobium sp.]
MTAFIGPNAISRVLEAIDEAHGENAVAIVLERAGLMHYAGMRPANPVPEADVTALHAAARSVLGPEHFGFVMRRAGKATAEYLIFNRIPTLLQGLIRLLPARLGARLLLTEIGKNAATFGGSGAFTAHGWYPITITIRDNPLTRGQTASEPVCHYDAATFEQLFQRLVDPAISVKETTCEATGDGACTFVLHWPGDDELRKSQENHG